MRRADFGPTPEAALDCSLEARTPWLGERVKGYRVRQNGSFIPGGSGKPEVMLPDRPRSSSRPCARR
jgi:hypothetical protein